MSEKRFYTIKELQKEIDRTAATIYNFIRSSEETKAFFNQHRRENSKGGYIYDEEVLKLLKNKYLVANDQHKQDLETESGENPQTQPPAPQEKGDNSQEMAELAAELEELLEKYAALKADFDKIEAEKDELLRQNGNLLLLLSQEKAEKQALLPPPRKSIGERLKSIFHKSDN